MDGIKVKKRTALSAGEAVAGCLRSIFGNAINGVFPDKARTDVMLPYIIYQVDGDMETNDKSRSSFLDSCTVTLHCFATHYGDAVDMAEVCRASLSGSTVTHTFGDGSTIKIDCPKITGFSGDVDPDCYDRVVSINCRVC